MNGCKVTVYFVMDTWRYTHTYKQAQLTQYRLYLILHISAMQEVKITGNEPESESTSSASVVSSNSLCNTSISS